MKTIGTCLKEIMKKEMTVEKIKEQLDEGYNIEQTEDGQLIVKLSKKEDITTAQEKIEVILLSIMGSNTNSELYFNIFRVQSGLLIRLKRINRR